MKTLTNDQLTNHVVDLMSISLEIVAALDGQLPLKVDLSRQRQDLSEMAGTIQQQLGFVQRGCSVDEN